MFRTLALSLSIVLAVLSAAFMSPARAEALQAPIDALAQGGFDEREKAVADLAATQDPRAVAVLQALGAGTLYVRKSDKTIVIGADRNGKFTVTDPLSGKVLDGIEEAALDKIRVNNRLRRAIDAAMGSLTLVSTDAKQRRDAAQSILKSRDPESLPALEKALAVEKDEAVRTLMRQARAAAILNSDAPEADKLAAIEVLIARGDREALGLISGVANQAKGAIQAAAIKARGDIEDTLAVWEAVQNVWYGISLGSVLLLAAVGLAITFGVMGVINMAHGEMVMLGAYTTFVVQEIIRNSAPHLFDYSLLIALPLSFLVAGAIGIAIERSIIRWLYGRPLETLLATWGISLMLQQAVRSIFGAANREVGAPSWMSGAFELGNLSITYGRMWIVLFALMGFAALTLLLRRTSFGLHMRAVTQNRAMASAMGIRTPWVDALTFGLGSGIAGIAGVALSQIDNVSPNLGQGYIIDSFMVVVFGGVGNLWGTLVGSTVLGIVNKFLEPYAGAVLGKIFILVFIILFIQKRPRGLFALKGRGAEA